MIGSSGFASALNRDDRTGAAVYATLSVERFDSGARAHIIVRYAVTLPDGGKRLFPMLSFELRRHEGASVIFSARRLGRITHPGVMSELIMPIAKIIAAGHVPDWSQFSAFCSPEILEWMKDSVLAAIHARDEREEVLPEQCWDLPPIMRGERLDAQALAISLNLAAGEQVSLVNMDPYTNDYRVMQVRSELHPDGEQTLSFEMVRQGSEFESRRFSVMAITLALPAEDGCCVINTFSNSLDAKPLEFASLWSHVARIVAALQAKKWPSDDLLFPLLAPPAQELWSQPPTRRVAS